MEHLEIGTNVVITDEGETYDTYRAFVKKHGGEYVNKYEDFYVPENGDNGVIVGVGKHQCFSGMYYVVLVNDKAICISEKGIKKAE